MVTMVGGKMTSDLLDTVVVLRWVFDRVKQPVGDVAMERELAP